mmetsp:Transcript_63309/g.175527  ORF Transcript_63309/g.175527 Transcript_63309/m.175527 type:complete len:297 (+) Transcript_63309:116-1006(+)|eukprot:CAMPEP_0179143454 /NCGR_PEP_ID=MMETSP0796-20121207/69010_1 /TAXON_ID=73915 /ORGANISM="Pyrodinium bahamense, Strain pbaha01" /LENGTH=296 /DNA_ID=CAMNT_0020843509 /DNA_START=112 /DNA_END=1002 /DNA_ORIENTATION=-
MVLTSHRLVEAADPDRGYTCLRPRSDGRAGVGGIAYSGALRGRMASCGIILVVACVSCILLVRGGGRRHELRRHSSDPSDITSFQANLSHLKEHLKDLADARNVSNITRQRFKDKLQEARENGTVKELLSAALMKLAPKMNMTDGNVCRDDEELLNSLCYKKCNLLTNGTHPIRTSPWHCCSEKPCFLNQLQRLGVCGGFSVAGGEGGSCPHAPGACLKNEEFHGGHCFKKCGLLTNGSYPTRVGAYTCCRVSGFRCYFPSNLMTRGIFNVAGGAGDGDASTPGQAHMPMPELTEN